MLLTYKFQWHH